MISACEPPEAASPKIDQSPPPTTTPPAPSTLPAAEAAWRSQVTGAGHSLAYGPPEETGDPQFRLSCARDSADITLVANGIAPIGSEDRITIGFDDELIVFVATPESLENGGLLEGRTAATQQTLDALTSASRISGSYGATPVGPYPAPPRDLALSFVQSCRTFSAQ